MIHKLVVFISSAADLADHRDAVDNLLGDLDIDGSRFEAWPSVPNPHGAMAECLRRVEESDAVVLLLGDKYGTVIKDGLSATHLEYRHARIRNRPVFPFVLHSPEREPKQAEFVKEIEQHFFRGPPIRTIEELEHQVKEALLQEFVRCFREVYAGPPTEAHFRTPPTAPVTHVAQELSLSDDPQLALEQLVHLYEKRQNKSIQQLAPQIELKFGDIPQIVNLMYMAEVNLAMHGGESDTERLEMAIEFWNNPELRQLFAPYSLEYNQGNALGVLKRHREAIVHYKSVLSQQPDFAPCWKNLGTAYLDVDDRLAAHRCLERAVEYDPHLFEARYSLATMAIDERAYKEALSHFQEIKLHELDGVRRSWVHGWQAIVHHHLAHHAEAIRSIETAIALYPDTEWPWLWAGRIYAVARRADPRWIGESRSFGERLVSRFPDEAEAWGELGYTYWRLRLEQDDEQLARKCVVAFSKAIELGFVDQGLIPDRLGHVYMDNQEFGKAEAAFRLAVEHDALSFGYCLGVSLINLGRYDDALQWITAAAEKHQPDALSWGQVAFCYDKVGDRKKAIAGYEKAVELDPDYALAWFNLGGMYWNDGNASKAIEVWREAIRRFPNHELATDVRSRLKPVD